MKNFLPKNGRLHRILRLHTLFRAVFYLLLIGIAFVFLYPFLFMLITSVKSNADLFNPTVMWIPSTLEWSNYTIAFRLMNYLPYLRNSVLVTLLATIGHVLSCSLIGYGFARYSFPLKRTLFVFVVLSIIVPTQSIIIPLYLNYAKFGWINSYLPMIIPAFFGFGLKGGLFIFIFRQFYHGLPVDLENAARIDGCGFLRIYARIIFPIAKSAYLVVFVLSLIWHWNDFYEASIFLDKTSMMMLPTALYTLIGYVNQPPPPSMFGVTTDVVVNSAVIMAGAVMVVLPMLLVFSLIQRQFMVGIERTGLVE